VGQSNRLINTRDWSYEYIERLQQRGYLLGLNPTDLPYTTGAVRKALHDIDPTTLSTVEAGWYRQLIDAFPARPPNLDSMRVGGVFTAGARRSSSRRLNVLEPLGDGAPLLPRAQINGYMEWGPWIGQAGATFDRFYDVDPDGLDTAKKLMTRSEEVYLGYNGRLIDVYLGRFDNHWSLHGRRGALLTDNPRSFDQAQLRFGNSTLSFQSIFGTLDNFSDDGPFTKPEHISGDSFDDGAIRRYILLHRLDWSPTANLKLSAIEAELYHSTTAGISLENLIPLHTLLFTSHNVPRNNDSNLMLGGGIWYQVGPVTLYAQGMLDDILVSRREERKRSGDFYPAIYTTNGSVNWAGITDRIDAGIEVDVVSANSYRTDNWADQWSYIQRGLATNFSDYVRLKGHATWYPTPGLEVEPALTWYRKGEGDFRELRVTYASGPGGAIPSVLLGTVERTLRPSVSLRYQPVTLNPFDDSDVRFQAWIDANVGVNFIRNAGHIEDATDRRFVGLFRVFGQVSF
jgi:hypothetical protein